VPTGKAARGAVAGGMRMVPISSKGLFEGGLADLILVSGIAPGFAVLSPAYLLRLPGTFLTTTR